MRNSKTDSPDERMPVRRLTRNKNKPLLKKDGGRNRESWKITSEAIQIWKDAGFRSGVSSKTKIYKQSRKNLNKLFHGTLFRTSTDKHLMQCRWRCFTMEEFITSVENYALTFTPEYFPVKKRNPLPLATFLYSPFSPDGYKSRFVYYLENEPKKITQFRKKDRNPEITKKLKEFYTVDVLQGLAKELDESIKNMLITAAFEINKFFVLNEITGVSAEEKARVAIRAMYENSKDPREIRPFWFVSERFLTDTLPHYVSEYGYLRETRENIYEVGEVMRREGW